MGRVSKNIRNSRSARTVFSSILIAVVLAVALMPLASAAADTPLSATTPAADVPSVATPTGDDPAPSEDVSTPKSDDSASTDTASSDTATSDDATTIPTTDAPAPPFADLRPADDDGVDAAIENAAPRGGDGNEDGIADVVQANVASLPAAVDVDGNGALDDYVTIVSPEGTSLHGVSALEVPADSEPPEGAVFHYGLFDYEVQVANPGDNADVTFILPSGPAAASVYMFQDGAWTEVTQHADIDLEANQVTVGLQDGGLGDADHAADGVIDDPVGVAGNPNTITVTKVTSPAGLTGSFTMTLAKCSAGSTGSACSSPVNETPTFSLSHGQSGTWGTIELNRNYRLTETVPSGWNNPTIGCTGSVTTSNGNANQIIIRLTAATDDTACTVTNTPQTGSITITKAVPSTDPTDFPFTATGPSAPGPFSLDDDGSNTNNPPTQLPSAITFNNLLRDQTYTFTELMPAGWALNGTVSCSNTTSEQTTGNSVSVVLNTSSTINCTFNNVKNIASVTIVKDVSGGTDATDFHFTTTGGLSPSGFDLDDDGNNGNTLSNTRTYTDIPANQTYTFTEGTLSGWALGSPVACSGTSSETQIASGVSIPLTPGQVVTCTFVNTKFSGTITVHKGGTRANPAGTDTPVNYANGLPDAVFEYSVSGVDSWSDLCTTNASGNCTSAAVPPGTYDVREKSAPLGWSTISQLTYGGDSSGTGNQVHDYVGTVTVGTSGTFEPVVQYTNDSDDTTTHRFVNVKDDKPLPAAQCGIKIAMILDVSGSIGRAPSSATIYKDAANSFITTLAGTPTTLTRIVKFSDSATVVNPGNFPINLQSNSADATTEINNVYSSVGGGTNWDAALKAMAGSGADVVVMVTDGNPTTWDGSPNGGGGDIFLTDLAAGIASANSLKSESTIIAVGVGNPPAVTATNLAAISGPGRFFTSNLDTIKAELAALANQLCGSRIHVQKWVGDQLTNGWTFAGAATGANVSYPKGQVTGGGSNPPLPTGEMQINLDNVPVAGATSVSVAETVQANYGVVGRKCQKVGYPTTGEAQAAGNTSSVSIGTVLRNEDWYCTFVNQQNPGSVLVQKSTVGALGTFTFSLTGQSDKTVTTTQQSQFTSPASGAWSGLAPGQYTITEQDPGASWVQGDFTCKVGQTTIASGPTPLQFTLTAGQSVTCQIANTKKGSILVQKRTLGALGTFDFTLSGQSGKSVTTTQQNTYTSPATGAWTNLAPGQFTIDETDPGASWVEGSFTCMLDGTQTTVTGSTPQIALAAGQSWTCQITNTRNGTITVEKKTVGGTGSFNFTLTGQSNRTVQTVTPGVFLAGTPWSNLVPGNYTIDEVSPGASWVEGSFTCTLNGTQTTVTGASPQIALAAGQSWTCQIINTQKGSVLVQKRTVGGVGSFDFTLSGQSGKSVTTTQQNTFTQPASGAWSNLTPGQFTIDETDPDASWIEGPFSCTAGGNPVASGDGPLEFTLDPGADVICRVTNTKKGSVLVEKRTLGGVGSFDFTLSGQSGKSVTTTQQNTFTQPASGAWSNLTPGQFTIDETDPDASWIEGPFTCTVGDSTIASGDGPLQFTLDPGADVVCQITNTKNGTITVEKKTVGDVGSFDFTLTGQSGRTVQTVTPGVFLAATPWSNLVPGNYAIDETDPGASWVEGAFTCTLDGTQTTVTGSTPQIPLAAGQSWTCQVTNTKKGSVLVEKRTLGGVGSFDFTLSGQSGKSVTTTQQNTFTQPASGAWSNLTPGQFTIDETDPDASWIEGPFTCTVGDSTIASGDGPLQFTLDPGADVVCQITNTKKGSVLVEKQTVGALGSFDFTLSGQSGKSVTTTQQNVFTQPASGAWSNLMPGQFTIDETDPDASWVEGSFTCTVGDSTIASGDGPLQFTLDPGADVVCQITNTKKGTITVVKTTVGGVGSFDFTLSGQSGRTVQTVAPGTPVAGTPWSNLVPGQFTIDETDPGASWVEGAFTCTLDGTQTQVSGASPQIPVGAGESWTCQIVNTKKGSVLVEKRTLGGVGSFDFTLSGQSGKSVTTTQQNTFTQPASGAWSNLTPGQFTIDETDPDASWIEGPFTCTVGDSTIASGDGPLQFTLDPGADVVCRITNTKNGTITVEKKTVGDVGSFDFTLTGQSGRTVQTVTPGVFLAATPWSNLVPGNYAIDETDPGASWVEGAFTCTLDGTQTTVTGSTPQIPLAAGQSWTCQVTNTKKGSVLVEKRTLGGVGSFDFTLSGQSGKSVTTTQQNTFTQPASGAWSNLTPGQFTIDETDPDASWIEGPFTCTVGDSTIASGDGPLQFTLDPGADVVCQITNTKKGTITIVKKAVPQDAQNFTFNTTNLGGPFTLDDDADGTLSNTKGFPNLAPGTTYTVTEVPSVGWKLVLLECTGLGEGDTSSSSTGTVSVDMKPGQVVQCTYTNQSPDLGVVKSDDPDPVVAGTQLTYTVVATNHGPADATGVVVTDTLDPNTTFVSTSLGTDCSHAAGVVTCELGDLLNGDFVQFTITVLVSPGAPVGEDSLNNVVDVEGDQPDWNPENNHDEEPTSVISELDLAITKTDGGARPVAGQGSFTYTLSVDNLGPSDAQEDATVIDLLPAEVTFVSFGTLAAGVTCDPPVGRTITCSLDKDLLDVADDPVTIPIEVSVKAGTPSGDITNKTIVTSPDDEAPCTVTAENITCDPSNTNNYDEAVTPVTAVGGISVPGASSPTALAFTGSSSQTIALLGGLLLGAGAIFLLATRRRRKKAALGS